jgi:hypothetical protein
VTEEFNDGKGADQVEEAAGEADVEELRPAGQNPSRHEKFPARPLGECKLVEIEN